MSAAEKRSGPGRRGRLVRVLGLGLLAACAGPSEGGSSQGSGTSSKPRQSGLSYERLKEGVQLQQQGRHLDAVSAFESALSADLENGLAYLHLAESQVLLDEPPAVILAGLEKAVGLLPDNPRAHHHYAEALAQSGELQVAARHWRRALELRPDVAEARLGLAQVLEASKDLEGARTQLEAAATLDPGNVVIHVRLANVLEQLSNYRDAGDHAREAAQLSGASAPLYRRAADLFEKAEDRAEAQRLRAAADRIDPPPKQRKLRELREARAKGPSGKRRKR
jgi:tetratricopeptide (TPR) repeat protein